MEVVFIKCPSCQCAVDMNVMHLTSLLGPPEVACHWCGGRVGTERMEWSEMGGTAKTWFFGVSFVYMVLAFCLGGLSGNSAIRLWQKGRMASDWGIEEASFWLAGGAWVALVVIVQIFRVFCSRQRDHNPKKRPLRGSLLSLQVGGQMKVLLLLLAIPAVCWLAGLIARRV